MAFRTNTSKAQEGGNPLKPEGDYEVIIDTAEVTRTQSGKDKINIVYVIRNDVQQAYQNGLIFDSIWKKKEPNEDDQSIGGFNFGQLMAIANAAKLPDGKEYAGLDDFLAELKGKPLRVHLYHDDYNDKWYEKIDRHEPTTLTAVKRRAKGKSAPAQTAAPATAPAQNAAPASDPYPF
jgi:hypothetical protein